MLYQVVHQTRYEYDAAVSVSQHLLYVEPRSFEAQEVLEYKLEIQPGSAATASRRDFYGNSCTFVAVEQSHRAICFTSRSRILRRPPLLPDPERTPAWEQAVKLCAGDTLTPDTEASEYLFESPHIKTRPEFAKYAAASFTAGRPILQAVTELNSRIYREFKFDPRATNVATPVSEVFKNRRGVCQDFAHVAISCLRSVGLPARYVSGYIETIPPPGKPRLVGADASHAWFAVWCPGHGWIDADPTNNQLCGERHLTVAWGRDFSDVSPVRGVVVGGGEQGLMVSVDVERLDPASEKKEPAKEPGKNGDEPPLAQPGPSGQPSQSQSQTQSAG